MSNFKRYFNMKTMEERQAFLRGLSPEERLQLRNESLGEFLWIIYQPIVEALTLASAKFHAAVERFIEACENVSTS